SKKSLAIKPWHRDVGFMWPICRIGGKSGGGKIVELDHPLDRQIDDMLSLGVEAGACREHGTHLLQFVSGQKIYGRHRASVQCRKNHSVRAYGPTAVDRWPKTCQSRKPHTIRPAQ